MTARRAGRPRAESVAPDGRAERRAFLAREGLILLGFLLLVAAAVVTVVVPELSREPEGAEATNGAAGVGTLSPSDAPPAAPPGTPTP